MPWKTLEPMDQRIVFCQRAALENNHAALCREYEISRRTGYKWLARYRELGASGMSDQRRTPKSHSKQLPERVVCDLIALKNAHPNWGPKKIRDLYRRKHLDDDLPSLSSVKRVLERAGLTQKRVRRTRHETGRLTSSRIAEKPNDIWTIDFKGWWHNPGCRRVEPFTVRDEKSRKILAITLLANTRTEAVKACFIGLFETYGLPGVIRSDNGSPFASHNALLGLTRLSVWLIALGIECIRGRPGCPQDNGAHERMHRDISVEMQKEGVGHDQDAFDLWREEYNGVRPHEALEMKTPDEVYTVSEKKYPQDEIEIDYGTLDTRLVGGNGMIKYQNIEYRISTALSGYRISVRDVEDFQVELCFGRQLLGMIDLKADSFLPHVPETKTPRKPSPEL